MVTAVLLAAGRGERLRPLTDHVPKTLVAPGGTSFLVRWLDHLRRASVDRVVVVGGYRADQVFEAARARAAGLELVCVRSEAWASTNNVVSLLAAAPYVQGQVWVIEGDLLVDGAVVALLDQPDVLLVDAFDPSRMSGTTLSADEEGRVAEMWVGARPEGGLGWKTLNLSSLGSATWAQVVEELGALVAAGEVDAYYEEAFARLLRRGAVSLHALPVAGRRWAEVDTPEDLEALSTWFVDEHGDEACAE